MQQQACLLGGQALGDSWMSMHDRLLMPDISTVPHAVVQLVASTALLAQACWSDRGAAHSFVWTGDLYVLSAAMTVTEKYLGPTSVSQHCKT